MLLLALAATSAALWQALRRLERSMGALPSTLLAPEGGERIKINQAEA